MNEDKLDRAIEMMIKTDHMHKALIETRVSELGIHRTQHRILMHLARKGTLPSQKEIADHLNVSPAAITFALKKIEKDGYIEKTPGIDNRYYEVRITEKGRDMVKLTHKIFSETDKSIFNGFSETELEIYISFLEKLQNNIDNQLNKNDRRCNQ